MAEKEPAFYKIKVNEFEFYLTQEQAYALDLVQKSPETFNVIKDNKSLNAVLAVTDERGKKQTIQINGESFDIQIKDELDQMLDQMGLNVVAGKQIKEIKAPMPGMVLEIAVSQGQQVAKGDKVLILVAMKMENSLILQADATIKRLAVKAGDAVDKGQLLVELE